jgi:hypothetical protein
MAQPPADLVDPRLAKAVSHPMRSHILTILNERVASPSELAELIEEPLPNVSYHVRALHDLECIELVGTAQRRGAVEHYYRALTRPLFEDQEWKRLPASIRREVSRVGLRLVWDDVSEAIATRTFENRPDRHLSRAPLVLDEQGWDDVNSLLRDTYDRAEQMAAESATRLANAGDQGIPSRLVMMHFEAAGSTT